MSDQGNAQYSLVKDTILSKSNLLHGVDGVNTFELQQSSIAIQGGNASTTAIVLLTDAQIRQAVQTQLVIESAGANPIKLCVGGVTSAGASAAQAIQNALGFTNIGDAAMLRIVNTGTACSIDLRGDTDKALLNIATGTNFIGVVSAIKASVVADTTEALTFFNAITSLGPFA